MKSFLLLFVLSTVLVLSACNGETPKPEGDSGNVEQETDSQSSDKEDTSSSDSINGFSISTYDYNGNTYYHYETTPEELISMINEKMIEKGYSEFELRDKYISEFDNAEDSYYYYVDGKSGKLTINTYHGVGKVVQSYLVMNDSETEEEIKLNQHIAEIMIDIFAPNQSNAIATELDLYSIRSSDEYEYRELTFGNSKYRLSVPDEFTINPVEY